MKSSKLRIACLVRLLTGISIVTTTAVAAGDLSPIEAYSSVSEIRNIAISPSGKRVAYQQIEGGRNLILVLDVSSGELVFSLGIKRSDLNATQFIGDDKLMFVYDWKRPYGDFGLIFSREIKFLDLTNGHLDDFSERSLKAGFVKRNSPTGGNVGIGEDFETLYMPMWEGHAARFFSLFEYSFKYGTSNRALARGSTNTIDWFIDNHGRPLVREDFDPAEGRHTVYVYRNGKADILMEEWVASRNINIVALTPQRDKLIFSTHQPDSDQMTLHTVSLKDGSRSEPVFS